MRSLSEPTLAMGPKTKVAEADQSQVPLAPKRSGSRMRVVSMGLVILTGASGSGKTTIAERIEKQYSEQTRVFRFDSIEVPSTEERIARWGAGSGPGGGWQRAMTIEWLGRIARERGGFPILFEGQMRSSFIMEGLATAGIAAARIVLVHRHDATRTHRLCNERNQPGRSKTRRL
jgi:hypothetical protein